jgi:hypothetical protein
MAALLTNIGKDCINTLAYSDAAAIIKKKV